MLEIYHVSRFTSFEERLHTGDLWAVSGQRHKRLPSLRLCLSKLVHVLARASVFAAVPGLSLPGLQQGGKSISGRSTVAPWESKF